MLHVHVGVYHFQLMVSVASNWIILASHSTLHVEHGQHPQVLVHADRVHERDEQRATTVLGNVMTRADEHLQNVGDEAVHLHFALLSASVLKIKHTKNDFP